MSNLVPVLFDKDTGRKILSSQGFGGGGGAGIPPGFHIVIGYHHVQTTPALVWHIHHNAHTDNIVYTGVFDSGRDMVMPDRIHIVDQNNVDIFFAEAMVGTANLALFT